MKAFASILLAVVVILAVYFYRTASSDTAHFAGVSLKLDLATTPVSRELGLGGRSLIPSNYGMLFVFPRDGYYGFWMKDTLVPLDMYWLNDQRQVIWVEKDIATSTYPAVFESPTAAHFVLETAAGFAELHNVATGTILYLPKVPNVSQ